MYERFFNLFTVLRIDLITTYHSNLQGAVGLELWSMSNDIYFDNFIITDNKDVADKWAEDTWAIKHEQEELTSPSPVNLTPRHIYLNMRKFQLCGSLIQKIKLWKTSLKCLLICSMQKLSFQKSVVDAVADATKDRPWLWAVIILVVLLPLVLIIAYCCMPSSSSKVGLLTR